MQPEEPRCGHERQADEDEPGVPPPPRRIGRHDSEREVYQAGREDQPEVRRVVFPAPVRIGPREQQQQADQRDGQERGNAQHA
jgi:hypothetical protein